MKTHEHPSAQTIRFRSKTKSWKACVTRFPGHRQPTTLRGFEGALWMSKCFWSALQSVRPKGWRVIDWSSDTLLNTLSTAMPTVRRLSNTLISPPPLVNEQCPTLCLLSSLLLFSWLPLVQHGDYFCAALPLHRDAVWLGGSRRGRQPF